jgi:hypothetical protein
VVLNLAALGVGRITTNDPQCLDVDNLNRFPTAALTDVGKPKVQFLGELLSRRSCLSYDGITAQTEDFSTKRFYRNADYLVCCSNTTESRIEAAKRAVHLTKPLIDVSVADGRRALAGFVKLWLPENANWSACPACFLGSRSRLIRGEGLIFTLTSATAALACHVLLEIISCHRTARTTHNFLEVDFVHCVGLAVRKIDDCVACGADSDNCNLQRSSSKMSFEDGLSGKPLQ